MWDWTGWNWSGWYWTAAALLLITNSCCLLANLLMLPGNWMMVAFLALFVSVTSAPHAPGWSAVFACAAMAAGGEVLEMITGSAQASRYGASRRAMLLSLLISIVGSVAGAVLVPVPIVGSAVGAVLGAALGAFAGAWLGETWKGSDAEKKTAVGMAAMTGRMIGMLAKLSVGIAIFVFQTVMIFF